MASPNMLSIDGLEPDQSVSHISPSVVGVGLDPLIVDCGGAPASHHDYLMEFARVNGFQLLNTVGGGDCFFDSVRQCILQFGLIRSVIELRLAAALELNLNSNLYSYVYLTEHEAEQAATYDEFVLRTRDGREWATQVTVAAMARSLNVVIRLVSTMTDDLTKLVRGFVESYHEGVDRMDRSIVIGFNKMTAHYIAFGPLLNISNPALAVDLNAIQCASMSSVEESLIASFDSDCSMSSVKNTHNSSNTFNAPLTPDLSSKCILHCNVHGCSWGRAKNIVALRMHNLRCHPNVPFTNRGNILQCNVNGCKWGPAKSIAALRAHERHCHTVDNNHESIRNNTILTTALDINSVDFSNKCSVEENNIDKDCSMNYDKTRSSSNLPLGDADLFKSPLTKDFTSHLISETSSKRSLRSSILHSLVCDDSSSDISDCSQTLNTVMSLSESEYPITHLESQVTENLSCTTKKWSKNKRICCRSRVVFSCPTCNKAYRTKGVLDRHTMTAHANDLSPLNVGSGASVTTCSQSTKTVNQGTAEKISHSGRSRKFYLASEFNTKLADLKKQYLSSEDTVQIDPLYDALKSYQQKLVRKIFSVTTERLSDEVLAVVLNPDVIGDERPLSWSEAEQKRLNTMNHDCTQLKKRTDWYWDPEEGSNQAIYNGKRLEMCMTDELKYDIVHCKECETDSLMVGMDQLGADGCCYECLLLRGREKRSARETEKMAAWNKVRPKSKSLPKRMEPGRSHEDLPDLYPGDKAVIALVHPVVTVKKAYSRNRKLRQESISLLCEPHKTWVQVLPRDDLKDRFFVLERSAKNGQTKHIIANRERVEVWLKYLFANHTEYKRRLESGELEISCDALDSLERQSELASVDTAECDEDMTPDAATEHGMVQPALESGFNDHHILAFDKFPNLYLKKNDFMKIKQAGKIEIITDQCERRPIYSVSANLCFPHLFPHGESAPCDFRSYAIAKDILKKQVMFAHEDSSGKLRWMYASEDIYMMYMYARLTEMRVHARVGFYISQHPSAAHLPLDSVVNAFKNGFDDTGMLDAKLPDLTMLMTQLPNSRQYWFQERQALEIIARDNSDPNLFMTINPEPRYSPDIRELCHRLHFPDRPFDREWNFESTEQFTELMSKYAPHLSVYMWRKTKIFMSAFLNDVCRIPKSETSVDWTDVDRTRNSYYWSRVEFTESRGFAHHHFLVRLPNTLEAGALGRMVQNMRVVRQELKCGNIQPSKQKEAWDIIWFGLLASRYLVLIADSVSSSSFYTKRIGSFETVDPSKVIDMEKLRAEFELRSKTGTHTLATHPLMRKFDDPECDPNPLIDYAQVVAATCIHQCLTNGTCGGDSKTGKGCRFGYPKTLMPCTVAAVMQVNSHQSEISMLLRRTNSRVCNSNIYISRHLRCNNDLQYLPDPATSLRYATKYCTKSKKHDVLLNEMVDHINSRAGDIMQPTVNEALSHLILADCSHRSFMSVFELSWYIMGLPNVWKSFSNVSTVAFHPRANLSQSYGDENLIEYSDRTVYSCYAERCNDTTIIKCARNANESDVVQRYDEVAKMCLREFAERITYEWKLKEDFTSQEIGAECRRKFTNRDVHSGHWELTFSRKRGHIRSSIRLFTKLAIDYELIDAGDSTSQTSFFDQDREKRQQLLRSYQELVFYVPWRVSPDKSFLNEEQRIALNEDPEKTRRYSLRRLQAFFAVYQAKWSETFGPRCIMPVDKQTKTRNDQWFRDIQYSYSMYIANDQNSDLRLDRMSNKGVLNPTYDDADELQGTELSIQPSLQTETDDAEYPSMLNFILPNNGMNEILHQPPPKPSEVLVAFPLQHSWQSLEDVVRKDKEKMFMARPPPPTITESQMTQMQRFAYDCMLNDKVKCCYVVGKAGSGKTSVGIKACEQLVGKIQCCAGTGRAASNYNAPTLHSALQWSVRGNSELSGHSANKLGQMRTFYQNTEVFLVDEINAISAECLARVHDTMTSIFNPHSKKNADGELLPFGGKKMIFLGDPAQLSPVMGSPIYDTNVNVSSLRKKGASRQMTMSIKGQMLYRKYLLPNTILLKKGQRNAGLLQIICDRIRDGTQTMDDLAKLTWLRRKFPDAGCDYGIHYDNESCHIHNLRKLWSDCQSQSLNSRLYICRASYEQTESNQSIVEGLACLPAKFYEYMPHNLCLSEMCLVRITKNINVGSGLVNGATGTVIKVLFDNADMQAVLDGKHPAPYAIVVEFESFRGFVCDPNKPEERFFPIEGHRSYVPIYREKVHPNAINIPSWIRKKQLPYKCYRQQFPLDLSFHMTAHRSQGQTLGNSVVSVDMSLDNPDNPIPVDIGSIIYVALTRVRNLVDLLVSPIFPTVWEKIGKSESDERRRKADSDLVKAAEKFSINSGKLKEYLEELNFKQDYSDVESEWNSIKSLTEPPQCKRSIVSALTQCEALQTTFRLLETDDTILYPLCLTPALSERHVGIDQGRKNFAVVCVDKRVNSLPKVVASNLYDLNLPKNFKIIDLALALMERTQLMNWMQLDTSNLLQPVDRVIVHIEQMSVKNGSSREFTIGLGKFLQSQAIDRSTCIVKLSQANVHRKHGPMFRLGAEIVSSLSLTASCYSTKKTDLYRKRPAQDTELSEQVSDPDEYSRKKKMSAAIYSYFINASLEQQREMGVEIDEGVQNLAQAFISQHGNRVKLDDLGDALLHSLNELLCGTDHFHQLVPATSSSVNCNRTVVIAVLPHTTCWVVLNAQFNLFQLEDMGMYASGLEGEFFRSAQIEKLIIDRLPVVLRTALTDFDGGSSFEKIADIKIIVKQLQGLKKYNLTGPQAGSLTQTAYNAMKSLADSSSPVDSIVSDRKNKTGHAYVRTNEASGQTFHVLKSSGKHLNAVVSFLQWFTEHANRVLNKRDTDLNQKEKLTFYTTLETLAQRNESRLEMLSMSDIARAKLASGLFLESETKKLLADLILIAINKNQSHIKAIAANYRANATAKKLHMTRPQAKPSAASDEVVVEQMETYAAEYDQYSDVEPDD